MAQDVVLVRLAQVQVEVFFDFAASVGREGIENHVIDFFAGGKETAVDAIGEEDFIDGFGQLFDQALALFEFDVVTFSGGHIALNDAGDPCPFGKASGLVGSLIG